MTNCNIHGFNIKHNQNKFEISTWHCYVYILLQFEFFARDQSLPLPDNIWVNQDFLFLDFSSFELNHFLMV